MKIESGFDVQLDVLIREQSVALEYQGEQNFSDIYALGSQFVHNHKNLRKKSACESKGITLIVVPYWWDMKKESLMAGIHKSRPDLIVSIEGLIPIPDRPQTIGNSKTLTIITEYF